VVVVVVAVVLIVPIKHSCQMEWEVRCKIEFYVEIVSVHLEYGATIALSVVNPGKEEQEKKKRMKKKKKKKKKKKTKRRKRKKKKKKTSKSSVKREEKKKVKIPKKMSSETVESEYHKKAKHFSFPNCCLWSKERHPKRVFCTYCSVTSEPLHPRYHFHGIRTRKVYDPKEPWEIETEFAFHSPSCALAYLKQNCSNFEVQARKLIHMLHSFHKYDYKLSCPRMMLPRELQWNYFKTFPTCEPLFSLLSTESKDFTADELNASTFLNVSEKVNTTWRKLWTFDE
jgi:hypothetical protein